MPNTRWKMGKEQDKTRPSQNKTTAKQEIEILALKHKTKQNNHETRQDNTRNSM